MSDRYILDGHTPVACPDLRRWGAWFESAERHVGNDTLPDGTHVSTVFLGLDHAFGAGPPVLFETMIFGGKHNDYQERYQTWNEAVAGHALALKLANGEA